MPMTRDDITARLAAVGFIADREFAMTLVPMDVLGRPLLLEGT